MNKSALLIIDIQKDFTQPSGRYPVDPNQAQQIIGNINAILASTDAHDLLPVYIGNEFRKWDPSNVFRNFCSLESSEGSKLDPRLNVANRNYFAKRVGDAFSNDALVAFLRDFNVEHVLLAGLYAESCVYKTFQGARKYGFTCSVVGDAIASKTESRRQSMIGKLAANGAKIVSTSELVRRPS